MITRKRNIVLGILLSIGAAGTASPLQGQTATFTEVVPLDGIVNDSIEFHDMTSDGSILVGTNKSIAFGTGHTIVWQRPAPVDCLRDGEGACLLIEGERISGDGSYFAGSYLSDGTGFRWTPAGGFEYLVPPGMGNPYDYVIPTHLSYDGSVVAGVTYLAGTPSAFRWTVEAGLVHLGSTPTEEIVPSSMSADGRVIVGYRYDGTDRGAFRWTTESGLEWLNPGVESVSNANAVSPNGRIVAGYGNLIGEDGSGYVWSEETGAVSIPFPPGITGTTIPTAVSDAGVIVGTIFLSSGAQTAFVFDPIHGTRLLVDELLLQGAVNVSGWDLFSVSTTSDDCLSLTGPGIEPVEGRIRTWFATLVAPARHGDVNCDGRIDGTDIQAFAIALVNPGDYLTSFPNCEFLTADVNGDQFLDAGDVEPFLQLVLEPH